MLKRMLTAAACAAALAACNVNPHPVAVHRAAGHDIALYLTPGVAGEQNDVRVEVRGARIPAITHVTLSMPNMQMPPQRVALIDTGDGSYHAANVRFSMNGTWHVAVIERGRGGGAYELTSFDVPVR